MCSNKIVHDAILESFTIDQKLIEDIDDDIYADLPLITDDIMILYLPLIMRDLITNYNRYKYGMFIYYLSNGRAVHDLKKHLSNKQCECILMWLNFSLSNLGQEKYLSLEVYKAIELWSAVSG